MTNPTNAPARGALRTPDGHPRWARCRRCGHEYFPFHEHGRCAFHFSVESTCPCGGWDGTGSYVTDVEIEALSTPAAPQPETEIPRGEFMPYVFDDDEPETDSDDLNCFTTSCVNCGDDPRHRLPNEAIKWTPSGDALCPDCQDSRGVHAVGACACAAPQPEGMTEAQKYEAFGRAVREWACDTDTDFWSMEISEDLMPLAQRCGLADRVTYDPSMGAIDFAEPGDEIWLWTAAKGGR